jgi:hypothetical protein
MAALLLSGGAYGADWLPLISPLVVILMILYAIDLGMKYYKKWRLGKENRLIKDNTNLPDAEDVNS